MPDFPHTTAEIMNCMDVCGGSGSGEANYRRPGLDVWVRSNSQGRFEMDGGDIHFLSSCASGRITRMLLADICGHGPAFHELAAELRDLMICNVNSIRQVRFIRAMHDRFFAASDNGGFATALLSTFFAPSRSLTLCNAGHASPLIYRAATSSWSVLKRSPSADLSTAAAKLGVTDQEEYQQFSTRIDHGDMVVCYSNVLAECRDKQWRTLGVDGVLRQVQQTEPTCPAEILSSLMSRLGEWNVEQLASQDSTLILCQATNRSVGWKNNVLAPFRLLRNVHDKTQIAPART